jgi:hypothetical protein
VATLQAQLDAAHAELRTLRRRGGLLEDHDDVA